MLFCSTLPEKRRQNPITGRGRPDDASARMKAKLSPFSWRWEQLKLLIKLEEGILMHKNAIEEIFQNVKKLFNC